MRPRQACRTVWRGISTNGPPKPHFPYFCCSSANMGSAPAHLKDVLKWRATDERPSVSHARGWGPVLKDTAATVGCVRAAASVAIIPSIPPAVVDAALQCVPAEVLPRVDDTRQSLAARLGNSRFLDDAHVLNKGNGRRGANGSKRRRLNESCHAAPRRKSWSVVVTAEHEDEDGEKVVALCNYSVYGRQAEDVRCAPMPSPVFALGEVLWLAAMPYLCEESRRNPPTHCQLLLYYVLFESRMGRHRDNYTVRHLKAMLKGGSAPGNPDAGMEPSMRRGSEVLLYTEGSAPMDFALSFPPCTCLDASIDDYICRSVFTVRLGCGTLVIFKDCDDQFFCHQVSFDALTLEAADPSGHRLGFVFRWCTSVKNFRSPPASNFKSNVTPPDSVLDV